MVRRLMYIEDSLNTISLNKEQIGNTSGNVIQHEQSAIRSVIG